jgi:ATP-binding cassette subfamily B protein
MTRRWPDYEVMAVRSRTSLSVVNIGQGTIIAFGLMAVMAMAGADIQKGNLTVGDFVAVNTYLLQLYLPLNFLGWVYRELRQALVDMERMFGCLMKNRALPTSQRQNRSRLMVASWFLTMCILPMVTDQF